MDASIIVRAFAGVAGFYDDYMSATGHIEAQRRLTKLLNPWLRGLILDVATGTGNMLLELQEGYAVDMDASVEIVRLAKRKLRRFDFVAGDAYNLPFKDGSFDYTMSCLALPWLSDRTKFLLEISRVTRSAYMMVEEEGTPALNE